jgi:hypothetical protein
MEEMGLLSPASSIHPPMRNYTRDEGRSFEFDNQGVDLKPLQAAVVKSRGRKLMFELGRGVLLVAFIVYAFRQGLSKASRSRRASAGKSNVGHRPQYNVARVSVALGCRRIRTIHGSASTKVS